MEIRGAYLSLFAGYHTYTADDSVNLLFISPLLLPMSITQFIQSFLFNEQLLPLCLYTPGDMKNIFSFFLVFFCLFFFSIQ